MSEYQRYEFMTTDRPLTRAQLDAVNALSSHIEASATHAIIEYHWGDFKYDPIEVLHQYFDGFLYWANWGSPQLAFRFPHGTLPADLLKGYDFDDFVTFTRHRDYDILDIHFGEMESPDEWTEYDLGSMISIRDELLEGDLRALYIAWLASAPMTEDYDDEDDEDYDDEDDEDDEDEDEDSHKIVGGDNDSSVPPVPSNFGKLTEAQQALAELLQIPQELLVAAGRHSKAAKPAVGIDILASVKLLPFDRRDDYLVRLARNEPGLSRQLVQELRELNPNTTEATPATGERVPYKTLLAESKAVKSQLAREKREQEELARQHHLQTIHDRQNDNWRQVEQAAARGTGSGYDEAVKLLVDLRDAAAQFKETAAFEERFHVWLQSHLRRPALLRRLYAQKFAVPRT